MGAHLTLVAFALLAPTQSVEGTPAVPTRPSVPTVQVPATPPLRAAPATAPVPGLGPRMAARIRHLPPDARVVFRARDLDPELVAMHGGRITARLGPVLAGRAPAHAIPALARAARYLEAPAALRPTLDTSRADVGADETDFAERFDQPYRGAGTLIGIYDTGVDLGHPDLRALDGPSRVAALWDQDLAGTPPPGQAVGHLCDRTALENDTCPHRDPIGHGTSVLGVAASSGPRYRGVAPEAELLVAASDDFEGLLEALAWFDRTATELEKPLVVNLSLSGQEGPHDGTSLECQALDALEHLSVVAAGNEGAVAVHALTRLDKGDSRQVALRFPFLGQPMLRRATVDVWGDVGLPVSGQVRIVRPGGEVMAQTSTVSPGDPGTTQPLLTETGTVGWVTLDAEAEANPFNGQGHLRIGLELDGWQDDPDGLGYVTVQLRGEGRVDLWVDSPASEPAPVRFDRERVLEVDDQILGDTNHTLSDLATAVSPLAVSAYVGRTRFEDASGVTRTVGGNLGRIASFSSYGPTLSETTTGPKPDLAAPGLLVITAKSQLAPADLDSAVSDLYAAGAGTSLAAPHVAGAGAVILGAAPDRPHSDVKAAILAGARPPADADPALDERWGAGQLDVANALGQVVARKSGCRCVAPTDVASPWLAVLALLALGRGRRRRG